MALSATIFKTNLQISDLDRNYYADQQVTLARHPSETDERMMVRLLAFIINADSQLSFTRGLSSDEEPELWQRSLTGEIELWIEVGLPDERRIRKACSRATQVCIYLYGGRGAEIWWQRNADKLARFTNLAVIEIPESASKLLASLVKRNMQLQCTLQEGEIWLTAAEQSVTVSPLLRKVWA